MNIRQKGEVERILRYYNADHDIGPEAPVTWREERLAESLLALLERVEKLEDKVMNLESRGD